MIAALARCGCIAAICFGSAAGLPGGRALAHDDGPDIRRVPLTAVDSWAYQLQQVKPQRAAEDGFDVLVVDFSIDGTDAKALTRRDLMAMRRREADFDRIILSYLSIGEAEQYRYYWRDEWLQTAGGGVARQQPTGYRGAASGPTPRHGKPRARLAAAAPGWLDEENPDRRGNFLVKFWEPDWQAVVFGRATAYLDRIIAAGFDGVYLDRIDSHEDWQPKRPTAEREMVAFVQRLGAYARAKKPGFLIVPQNGEELLKFPDYVAAIDAIAKEDLLYGGGQRRDGEANPEAEIMRARHLLDKARAAGRPVLAVEYLTQARQIEAAERRLLGLGYVPSLARRALDTAPIARRPTPAQRQLAHRIGVPAKRLNAQTAADPRPGFTQQ